MQHRGWAVPAYVRNLAADSFVMVPRVRQIFADLLPANRALWNGPYRRMLLFKWALCAALLSAMSLCPKLWTSDRAFPTVPAIAGLPSLPDAATIGLAWLLAATVLAIALLPRPRLAPFAVPLLGGILVLFDVTRLQPWFYQYMLLFIGLGFTKWDDEEAATSNSGWAICALIVATTYIWSGLQKANLSFGVSIFPQLVHAVGLDSLKGLWFLGPIVEFSIGALFCWPRGRTIGLIAVVGMHAFLLVALGPFGLNYNSVVWPWNVFMATMCVILLGRNSNPILAPAVRPAVGKAIAVLVGVMPILSLFGMWDDYLSSSLYSGKGREGLIMLTPSAAIQAPEAAQKFLKPKGDNMVLYIDQWALADVNVMSYPEVRAYKAVALWLQKSGVPPGEMQLFVTERPGLTQAKRDLKSVAVP